MGYVRNEAVIVTVSSYMIDNDRPSMFPPMPDIETFRAALPEDWQALLVGPIPSIVNGDETWFFAPDGSKEGWPSSDEGEKHRNEFRQLFGFRYDDNSSPFDVVTVTYDEEGATSVTRHS